jgi:hypothetical protein
MDAFSDLVVTFGSAASPLATRLAAPWTSAVAGPGGVWTSSGASAPVAAWATATAGSWTTWAVGDVLAYRGDADDPLDRFTADLAAGRSEPGRLDAHAAVVGWDDEARQLHVWVDRMGTVHVYAGGAPGRRRVGTVLAAVAEGSSGARDWVATTGFCAFGFYPADRTPYEDVRVLRPATHVVFDEGGVPVAERRTWDWWHDPDHGASDDELVDAFAEVWRSTLARQAGGRRVVVPVSGGLDSRTVLAGLVAPDGSSPAADVRAFTYGWGGASAEIAIARRVAAARGLVATEMVVGPYLFDRLDEVVGAVEGFQALSVSRQTGASDVLATLGDRIVGGHWGDVWFDATAGRGAPSSASGDLVEPAFRTFAKRGRGWLLDHVCRPQLAGRDPEDLLRELLHAELERLPDLGDPDLRLKALKTEQWSFRWTLASTRAYHLARPTLLPFYADDVVDLFLRVPSERLVGRRLQVAHLLRHHPDLARVRWQDTGRSLLGRPWEAPLSLARRAVAKGVRTARRRPVVERNWEVQYLTGDGPARLRRLLLEGGGALGDVAEPELASFVDRFVAAPDPASGYAVDVLATLATTGPGASVADRPQGP